MSFDEYVVGIIAAAVYLVCLILHSVKIINNRWLPLIAGGLGIAFNVWYNGTFDFNIFLTGLASGLSATGIDQIITQLTKKSESEDEQ